MEKIIKFKIRKKSKSYIIFIYNIKLKTSYVLEVKNISNNDLLNYKYIILFLIKLGLINVYL